MRRLGRLLVSAWVLVAVLSPWLAPYDATTLFPDRAFAPPTRLHVIGPSGLASPYFHPVVMVDPLRRVFEEDRDRVVTLRWFSSGHLLGTAAHEPPLLLLGADSLGRDLFSRLLAGARHSLALAALAVALSLGIGASAGVVAGYRGGLADAALQRVSDLVIVLPALYVLLALRAALPLDLPVPAVFTMMVLIFGLVGWPVAARGVRAIAARERGRDYVLAAEAAAASPARIMLRHLLPAASGFLRTQALLLLPAFVVAEATLSYAGLGLPDQSPGWGTLLGDASNIGALGGAVWLLAPAVALATLVLGVNLALDAEAPTAELGALAPADGRLGGAHAPRAR